MKSISFVTLSRTSSPSSFTTIRYFAYRQLALLMEERCTQVFFRTDRNISTIQILTDITVQEEPTVMKLTLDWVILTSTIV